MLKILPERVLETEILGSKPGGVNKVLYAGRLRHFSCLSHSHKMGLLALLGPFTDRNNRFPHPFIYLKPEKGTLFGRMGQIWAKYGPNMGQIWAK